MVYSQKKNTSKKYSVKDVDTVGRILSVYYSAFDNKDRDEDVILKGAFSKTIKEQGPPGLGEIWFLKFHDPSLPIVPPFELTEDSYGLLARHKMPDNAISNDVLNMYADGNFKYQSIGYRTIRKQQKNGYTELSELQLFEGSVVLWAANPAAKFVDIKSLKLTPEEATDELKLTIKALRDGKYTDETFALLEIKMRQLIQAVTESNTECAANSAPITEPELVKTIDYSSIIGELKAINNIYK
jgi:HK97 family phage prohead protease